MYFKYHCKHFLKNVLWLLILHIAAINSITSQSYPYTDDSCICADCGIDKYCFYKKQCTSYVAWRINNDLGYEFRDDHYCSYFPFRNAMDQNASLGHALNWDDALSELGYEVNTIPIAGSIAYWNANEGQAKDYGHVAYVESVNGSTISVSEYNWVPSCTFNQRTIDLESGLDAPSGFIHITTSDHLNSLNKDYNTGFNIFSSLNSVELGANELLDKKLKFQTRNLIINPGSITLDETSRIDVFAEQIQLTSGVTINVISGAVTRFVPTDFDIELMTSEIREFKLSESGLENKKADLIQFSPNPTNSTFTLTAPAEELENGIQIFSTSGQIGIVNNIQIHKVNDTTREIDLSHLPNGVYAVKTKTQTERVVLIR